MTPLLNLPLIASAQAQKHVTHNEALLIIDTLTQLCAKEARPAPPPAPGPGDRFLVSAVATGAFQGRDGHIARWEDEAWRFHAVIRRGTLTPWRS